MKKSLVMRLCKKSSRDSGVTKAGGEKRGGVGEKRVKSMDRKEKVWSKSLRDRWFL